MIYDLLGQKSAAVLNDGQDHNQTRSEGRSQQRTQRGKEMRYARRIGGLIVYNDGDEKKKKKKKKKKMMMMMMMMMPMDEKRG